MKDFIQFLVTSLVKNPQNVAVEESGEGSNFRYLITVDPSDMGLVIGKEGRTINSIRSLAKAKAVKENVWVDVELVDYGQPRTAGDKNDALETNRDDRSDGIDSPTESEPSDSDPKDPASNDA